MPSVYQPQQMVQAAQPRIFQPQQYQYMQAPQPPLSFPPAPVAAQPVIPNVPPPNVVPPPPFTYGGGQVYAQQGGGVTMPQPAVAAAQNNAAPVIPQMPQQQPAMAMPQPAVDPDPPRSRSRLAPGQYGPYDPPRHRSPSPPYRMPSPSRNNPLPRPPRDIFDSTPYIRLLDELRRPINTETLKRNLTVKTMQTQAVNVPVMGPVFPSGSEPRRERRHRKGLFNVFGRRHRDDDDNQNVVSPVQAQPVYYPTMPVQQPLSAPQMVQVDSGGGVPSATMPVPSRGPTPIPVREPSPSPQVSVHRENQYAGLIPSSPFSVHYNGRPYPTAFHLHEALKFMDTQPDVAEHIRTCRTVEEARNVSVENEDAVRDDWEDIIFNMMDEVIYQKLLQHEHLRSLLLNTGMADIVFSDSDGFWGVGPLGRGANELGRSLVRVRDRFRQEGFS
ncbi:hypothetical protein DAEQUDRAFT_725603 [Daedalea quercina L-15889]|uniref:NADAR domain-containing protein n=1 Tax=Daedalea quercina L-15889 TaxID=1314783 RepID=A0A165R557_9APHY|nr:hypothetical protein DAEQUDRAFT_725603 [Daedalea quercina L-15889]